MPDNQIFTNPSNFNVAASSKFQQIFYQNQKFFRVIWQATSLVGEDVSHVAEDSIAGSTGRSSNKTQAPAT